MGYIIAGILAAIILVILVATIRPGGRSATRREQVGAAHPVSREEPAADEPTPGLSDTNDPATIQKAQRRIPPA